MGLKRERPWRNVTDVEAGWGLARQTVKGEREAMEGRVKVGGSKKK